MGTGNGSTKATPKVKVSAATQRNNALKKLNAPFGNTRAQNDALLKKNNLGNLVGSGGGGNGSTKKDKKEPGWWKKKDVSGKTGQDKVVAGLEGASEVMGDMANAHAEANSGLTGSTGGVGKGAAVSSSGVVRDQDYQGYTEKKKKYGLT